MNDECLQMEAVPFKTQRILVEEEKVNYKKGLHVIQPLEIKFEDLEYSASLGFRKGTKKILHNLNGRFLSGQLIAIIGPSGAGKSVLLDALSGYRKTGVTGEILDNGNTRNWTDFRKASCYITQNHSTQPLLTAYENMKFAANLKLTSHYNNTDKKNLIENILEKLCLSEVSNTTVDKLSGGEKKRLSIALEQINSPSVMFLDEPTTGLDSVASVICTNILKQLALEGRTIICTIHQPSASLFLKFDHVYVLNEGKCLYQGSANNLVPYLEKIKLPCPKYHSPADYVIELACGEYGEDKIQTLVKCSQNGKSYEWFTNEEQIIQPLSNGSPICKNSRNSQMKQVKILLQRGWLKIKRDSMFTYIRIILYLLMSLLVGIVYFDCGNDGSKVFENIGLLFTTIVIHALPVLMVGSFACYQELPLLINERFNRWYSLKSFYIAISIVEIPVTACCCILYTTIVYLMTSQPLELNRLCMFLLPSLLMVLIIESLGFLVAVIFNNLVNAAFIGSVMLINCVVFSGFPITLKDIPSHLSWGPKISFMRYGVEGLLGAIYGMEREKLPCDKLYCHFKYPKHILNEYSMRDDVYNICIINLLLTLMITKIVSYFLLRWKIKSLQ